MSSDFYEVTVQYSGTKTYHIPITDGEPAATLGYIGENYYRLDSIANVCEETENSSIVSIIRVSVESA